MRRAADMSFSMLGELVSFYRVQVIVQISQGNQMSG